jgi:hypothetical protein
MIVEKVGMQGHCSVPNCGEAASASIDERAFCRKHFLTQSYQRLEVISTELRQRQFAERQADAAGRFLESCMRDAADIACAVTAPSNLEKAQVLDVLLWASELHGRLRRSPRVNARIPVQLRSEAPDHPWEEKTETVVLSRHGAQITCRQDLVVDQKLILIRLDKGWQADVRVVWLSRKPSGGSDVGIEFLADRNFWGSGSEASTRPASEASREGSRREEAQKDSPANSH